MSEFRLAPEAEAELDDIWLYIARGSGSIDTATRVVDNTSPNISGGWLNILIWAVPARTCGPVCAVSQQAAT